MLEIVDLDAAEALGFLVGGDKTVPVRCALFDVGFKNGLMESRTAVFDTNDTIVSASGQVNFADETLNLRVTPVPKDPSPLTLRVPFDVKGTFKKMQVSPDKSKLALRAGAAIVLGAVNPLAALLPLIETGPGKDSDCEALIARAKSEGVPVKNERTGEAPAARQEAGRSEQEVALRHRQHGGRLAGEQLAVGAHLVGLRVDLHRRRVGVVHHVAPSSRVRQPLHRGQRLVQAERSATPLPSAAWLTKVSERARQRAAEGAEHRPVVHRLRRRDAGVGVAHRGRGDEAALEHQARLDAEEGRASRARGRPTCRLRCCRPRARCRARAPG